MKSRCEWPSLPSQAPPETLVLGSLPSSLCPTLWCQCHQQSQWVTPPVGALGRLGGQEESLSPGGTPGAGPGCCRGPVGTTEPGIASLLQPHGH